MKLHRLILIAVLLALPLTFTGCSTTAGWSQAFKTDATTWASTHPPTDADLKHVPPLTDDQRYFASLTPGQKTGYAAEGLQQGAADHPEIKGLADTTPYGSIAYTIAMGALGLLATLKSKKLSDLTTALQKTDAALPAGQDLHILAPDPKSANAISEAVGPAA